MRDKYILTAESVTEGHPDKLCDTIADHVLDACLKHDPAARVACEVMAASEEIPLCSVPAFGEDSTRSIPSSFPLRNHSVGLRRGTIVSRENRLGSPPEPSAAGPVGRGGARERTQFSPKVETESSGLCDDEVLAHRLTLTLSNARKLGTIQGLGPDGKAQVSVEYREGRPARIAAVVLSCQHDVVGTSSISLALPQASGLTHYAAPPLPTKSERLCGGPFRSYSWGPRRNPAVRLRWGEEEGMERAESSPKAGTQQSGISSDEDKPIFARHCNYGHFTRQDAPWEQVNRATALADACKKEKR